MFRFALRFSFMPVELITSQPWWLLLLCPAAGLLYAFILYRKNHSLALSGKMVFFIALLRFITVTLLCFLISGAYVKSLSRSMEKPIIVFAQDNSSSLKLAHDSLFLNNYSLSVDEMLSKLSKKYEVKKITFGKKVSFQQPVDFSEPETDLSGLFNELDIRFANTNTGALIIGSDGIYNRGSNPLYRAKQAPYPVYAIALGDTVQKKDLLIASVAYNRQVSAGNKILMEVFVQGSNASGTQTDFKVEDENGVVFSRPLLISGPQFSTKIPVSFTPSGKGIKKYRLTITGTDGEITYNNNVRDVYMEITDRKTKILILYTSPHPDIAALKQTLETNPDYELTISSTKEFLQSFQPYSLVIFHQSPSISQEADKVMQALEAKVPCWFICGLQTSPALFNKLETGITIQDSRGSSMEILPSLNTGFSAFDFPAEFAATINNYPPLNAPFGTYRSSGQMQILLYQKIGNILTPQPLLAFNSVGVKMAVLTGEGLWKWRLSEYRDTENHTTVNEIIRKTVQYLLYREDKNPLRIFYKKEYMAGEPLILEAELYNAAGELTNEPDIKLTLTNENKKQFEFAFSKTKDKGYTLHAGSLEQGKYRFKAISKQGDLPVTAEGEFTIIQSDIESLNTKADHQLLNAMASLTGGKMYFPDQLAELADELLKRTDLKPISYSEVKLRDLIDLKWLLFLLIFWLSLEWFIRKRSGSY